MEWGYKFTDHPSAVAECLRNWKSTLALDHDQKYIVVFDITNTSRFSIKTLLQLSGFIALNKKRISLTILPHMNFFQFLLTLHKLLAIKPK